MNDNTHIVIDWASALPRRPGTGLHVVRQPIAREVAIVQPLWPTTPADTRPKTRSTGSGIVWAALIVTFGPIATATAIIALVSLALFGAGVFDALTASQPAQHTPEVNRYVGTNSSQPASQAGTQPRDGRDTRPTRKQPGAY